MNDVATQTPARRHTKAYGEQPADVLVVFGITGDLARVMTFRSLYRLERDGRLSFPIVGVAVEDWTRDQLIERARASILGTGEELDPAVFERFAARLSYVQGDFADASVYERVRQAIAGKASPVFYLEIPPFLFATVIKGLAEAGLTSSARVVVEKPFGHDHASARGLAEALHQYVDESQLYRIDHYLGKMGLEEILFLRFANRMLEPVYSHAGYYPGAKPIAMKLLFRTSDGRVLGAQAVGEDGVDKRTSEIALAIQLEATVYDLEECELCYAPPFGSAKDPINFAGMVAAGVLRGDMPLTHWDATHDGGFLLDVRENVELAVEQVPAAVHIPLGELRSRLDELPRDQEIGVICRSGQRAYYATRILLQNGFDAKVISGGMLSHAILAPPPRQEILA